MYNEKLTARIREALTDVRNVKEKKMFRGVAFMVDGKMCVSAGDDKIMCRIDPEMNDSALQKKGATQVIMRGRPYRGYVYVNGEGIKSQKDFNYWLSLALDFNKRAKPSRKKKKQ